MNSRRTMLGSLGAALMAPGAALAAPALQNATAQDKNYFPNAVFTTHEGRKVRFYDDLVRDKIILVNMLLITCRDGICPLMTHNLRSVQKALGDRIGRDVFMYSITLNPEYDTDFMLKAYAKSFDVQPGWSFLTGSVQETDVIRRKLGFSSSDPVTDKDPAQHTGMVRIGNAKLDRWCMMPGLMSAKQIATAVRNL